MRRGEAMELARARREGNAHARPQAEKPDTRPWFEQMREKELDNFDSRLAEGALKYEERFGHWPPERWFAGHRRRFLRILEEEYGAPKTDPPCKHWRDKVEDGPYREALETIWQRNIRTWALQYAYLASPSALCECLKCHGRPGVAKAGPRQWDEDFGPLEDYGT